MAEKAENLERELRIAIRLAREAGALVLPYQRAGVAVELKEEDEPVTRADREASELIVAGLRREFTDDIVISEEAADDRRRLEPGARVWYIDPIDGTRDFIKGRNGYAVMIGLVAGAARRPVLGVVYQPVGDNLFTAAEGRGTWLGDRRLATSTVDQPDAIRLVASKSHRTDAIDRVRTTLGITDEMNIGSVGLKLGLIALGERDLYVNPSSKSKAWDTCAPEALLTEAGGKITDLWGEPLRYDVAELRNLRGLLASNGRLHDTVVAKLAPLFPRP
jgi:3'(2'), 5'-bisphosphate nucleotidase